MTLEDSIHSQRLRVLRDAERLGNASEACRRHGLSRTLFYRLRKRFELYGSDGVHPKRRAAHPGRPPVRVTLEGDILLDLNVESSSRGADVNVAGSNYPSFGSRKVGTRLRPRGGESNLLAELLREDERKALNGFPGAINVPILRRCSQTMIRRLVKRIS
jgi:hypothetical protein